VTAQRVEDGSSYGWRARIGLILPADNVLMEPELYELALPGVSFHGLRLTSTDHAEMRRQALELAEAVKELGLDAVVYACAETSFNGGDGVRRTLSEEIAQVCGVPVVTATNALLAALEHTGAKKIAVATPYTAVSGEILEQTLADHGLEITDSVHRDFRLESQDPREWFLTNRQPSSLVYGMARSLDSAEADTIVLVSTNWTTLQVIEPLEQDTGKRVLTTNQSILWWLMRKLSFRQPDLGLGALFNESAETGA